MSFEGRYQKLCIPCNHYEEQDVYMESKKCPVCRNSWTKSNLVDDTNEGGEGYDESMVPKRDIDWDKLIAYQEKFENKYAHEDKELSDLAKTSEVFQHLMDKTLENIVLKEKLIDFIDTTEYPNPEFEKTFKKRIKDILA